MNAARPFTDLGADDPEAARRPIRWLWRGYVPRGVVTLLAGNGGVGKGVLVARLVADLSRGQALPGDSARTSLTTLIVRGEGEDDLPHGWRPRLEVAGADLSRVRVGPREDGEPVSFPRDIDAVSARALELGVGLVVIDSLAAVMTGDLNKSEDVRAVLNRLGRAAAAGGYAVLLLAHTNKGYGYGARDKIAGSTQLVNGSRSVLMVDTHPDDYELDEEERRRVLVVVKMNAAKPGKSREFRIVGHVLPGHDDPDTGEPQDLPAISWGEVSDLRAHDLGKPPKEVDPDDDRPSRAETKVLEALDTGPLTSVELLAAVDMSERTVKRARVALLKRGEVTKRRNGEGVDVWELATPLPAKVPEVPEMQSAKDTARLALGTNGTFGTSAGQPEAQSQADDKRQAAQAEQLRPAEHAGRIAALPPRPPTTIPPPPPRPRLGSKEGNHAH